MIRKYTPDGLEYISQNQVFVFGSNLDGFHGAGAAGLACRGDARNNWREDQWFLKAMKSPVGSPNRIGWWAVYGIARGFQIGKIGKSYAIPTVTKPGKKRSISILDIGNSLRDLYNFAENRSDLEFLITKIGLGLAGYSLQEMQDLFKNTQEMFVAPDNIIFPREYEFRGETK